MALINSLVWFVVPVFIVFAVQSLAQQQNTNQTTCQKVAPINLLCKDYRFPNCPLLDPPGECVSRSKETLYLIAMAPYPVPEGKGPGPSWAGGPEIIPGALLAACHINCKSTILPDYTLKLVIADGGCNQSSVAFLNFITRVFYSQENIVGIIGGGCSESSFTIGSPVARDEISLLQIAPSATSPLFVSQIAKYKNTFRVTVSAQGFVNVFLEIIKQKRYEEVGILYEATRSYMVSVYNHFAQALRKKGVTAERSFGLFSSYLEEPLNELENKTKLIFVFASGGFARSILCLAYHKNMLHPDYQFFFISRRPGDFLMNVTVSRDGVDLYTCDTSQMEEALSAATLFELRVTRQDKNTTTISGYTYYESECQYKKVTDNHKRFLNISDVLSTQFQNAYYDATWAIAMSLHKAGTMGVNLSNYTYGQPSVTKTIRDELLNVSFEGLSGKVQFNAETQDGSEVTIVDIFQRPNNCADFRLVGYYDPKSTLVMEDDIYFIEKSVFDFTVAHPPSALGYVFITLAVVVGLGIAILHCLNSACGDLKAVKATSPQLNHLIFSGCYLILLAVVLYSLETTIVARTNVSDGVVYGVLCNAQVWVNSLSVSLVFGTICVKTWRIFRIFSHFSSNPIKYIGDTILIGFVLSLVFIDTVYLIAWNAINPLVKYVSNQQPQVYRAICFCDNLTYWVSILAGYKLLLLGFVLYLSISTRHVNKPEFKQTKSINTLIYVLVFVNIVGLIPYAIIIASGTTNLWTIIAGYVTLSICYILIAIMCAVFVFLPPIYPLLKKKWKGQFFSVCLK